MSAPAESRDIPEPEPAWVQEVRRQGKQEGFNNGLRVAVLDICEVLGIPVEQWQKMGTPGTESESQETWRKQALTLPQNPEIQTPSRSPPGLHPGDDTVQRWTTASLNPCLSAQVHLDSV